MDGITPANVRPPTLGAPRSSVLRLVGRAAVVAFVGVLMVFLVGGLFLGAFRVAFFDADSHLNKIAWGIGGMAFAVWFMAPWFRMARDWRLRRAGPRAIGTITRVTPKPGVREQWVVRYLFDVAGAEFEGNDTRDDRPAAGGDWETGRPVLIAYDPARPSRSVMV